MWQKLGNMFKNKTNFSACLDPFFGTDFGTRWLDESLPLELLCKPDIDFFKTETMPDEDEYDCIITNIPFAKKIDVFRRLKLLKKPFCVLMPTNCYSRKFITENFKQTELQLLPIGNVNFYRADGKLATDKNGRKKPLPVSISFICWKMNFNLNDCEDPKRLFKSKELKFLCQKKNLMPHGTKAEKTQRLNDAGYYTSDFEEILADETCDV